jgi:type IV secretion system protein VirB9
MNTHAFAQALLIGGGLLAVLAGCQPMDPPAPQTADLLVEAAPEPAPDAPEPARETPQPQGEVIPWPVEPESARAHVAPQEATRQAVHAAKQEPTSHGFYAGLHVYTYVPGTLYQLYAAPEHITDIQLQPGETILAKAAGDTARWLVEDTSSGVGDAARQHLLLKPIREGLRTNMTVTTTRRVYHLALTSTRKTYMLAVAWRYPQDEFQALVEKRARLMAQTAQASRPLFLSGAPAIDPQALHFGYTIASKRAPVWMPLHVFDDGQKTYIQFPAALSTSEAPALFLRSAENTLQLVNYRVKDRWYIVDRLFDHAELRVGEKHPTVVTIRRQQP